MWLQQHYSKSPSRAALQCILFISWLCYLSATAVNAHLRALPDPPSDAVECNPADCCFVIQHLTLFLPGTNTLAPLNLKIHRPKLCRWGWGAWGVKPNYKHIAIEENIVLLLGKETEWRRRGRERERKRRSKFLSALPRHAWDAGSYKDSIIQSAKNN